MKTVLFFILFFPLAGAVFHALPGRYVPRKVVEITACASIFASFLMAVTALVMTGGQPQTITLLGWIKAGDFVVNMDVFYDPPAAIMAVMVTFAAAVIHLYSIGYMKQDEGYVRYFCFLNLFVFFMLVITLADNLIFLFLGWQGVGFCSYALIGFWYKDTQNATAGRKAFLLTRIGDVAFGVAIGLLFIWFNHLSISHIHVHAKELSVSMATLLGLLFLWSAAGKSAQLPLSVWLPDAMAGPTPVSALIQAATMVTAGVYLLIRLFPVISLSSTALVIIAVTGGVTAFFAAWSALAQTDIKRLLAYSTISQVGFMVLAVGVADVVSGMHLLLSHAFYTSLLFLAAGVIIHALHGQKDIFRMKNKVSKNLPVIFWLFLAGSLSLGGIPPFGGFFARDQIIISAFSHPDLTYKIIGVLGAVTVFLTALYSFRLFFVIFYKSREDDKTAISKEKFQKASPLMIHVLWPLAVFSLFAGLITFVPHAGQWLSHYFRDFYGMVGSEMPGSEITGSGQGAFEYAFALKFLNAGLAIAGLGLAFFLFGPKEHVKDRIFQKMPKQIGELCKNGFYLDSLYRLVVAHPFAKMAHVLWKTLDNRVIDGAIMKMAGICFSFSTMLGFWTTGRLSAYLGMLFLGFTLILCILLLAIFI